MESLGLIAGSVLFVIIGVAMYGGFANKGWSKKNNWALIIGVGILLALIMSRGNNNSDPTCEPTDISCGDLYNPQSDQQP
jgi:hypothetical protein